MIFPHRHNAPAAAADCCGYLSLQSSIVEVSDALSAKADRAEVNEKLRDKVVEEDDDDIWLVGLALYAHMVFNVLIHAYPCLSMLAQPSRIQMVEALELKADNAYLDTALKQLRSDVSGLGTRLQTKSSQQQLEEVRGMSFRGGHIHICSKVSMPTWVYLSTPVYTCPHLKVNSSIHLLRQRVDADSETSAAALRALSSSWDQALAAGKKVSLRHAYENDLIRCCWVMVADKGAVSTPLTHGCVHTSNPVYKGAVSTPLTRWMCPHLKPDKGVVSTPLTHGCDAPQTRADRITYAGC